MCLGGIMGSLASAVTEKTKNIVIEVANFAFDAIRRTSSRLALASDSSSRFVKGINPYQYDEVMGLATDLIVSLCKTKQIEQTVTYDARQVDQPPLNRTSVVRISHNRLGTRFLRVGIVETLKRDWMHVEVLNRR
jgi:phenylalanyl-tRNA synthetase beta chain